MFFTAKNVWLFNSFLKYYITFTSCHNGVLKNLINNE